VFSVAVRHCLSVLTALLVSTGCSGVSPNSASSDPWGGDDSGAEAGGGGGSGSTTSGGSGGSGGCGSCSADSDCQSGCGSPGPNQVWCCSQSVGCYQFSSTSCPMSSAGGNSSRDGGAKSGAACNSSSTCSNGMKCCIGLSGQSGATCQASCSSGLEACQGNTDCSGSGLCLIGVCLPNLGGGGSRLRDGGPG
jgi:hypothetical protein